MKKMTKNKKQMITKITISSIILILLILLVYTFFKEVGITSISKEQIQAYISSKGILGPFLFILISFLQVTFIPIPGLVTIVAGFYLFGIWKAFIYSFIGIFLGSICAFILGRKLGKPFIYWIVGTQKKVDAYLEKINNKEAKFLFLMFLLPLFPDDLLCLVSGISTIKFIDFSSILIITRLTTIGTTLLLVSRDFTKSNLIFIITLLTLYFITLITFLNIFSKKKSNHN